MTVSKIKKRAFYAQIDALRKYLNISLSATPIDAVSLAKSHCNDVEIDYIAFPSDSICGMMYKGANSTMIGLNSNREKEMQNFDCMHELIHYFLHDVESCTRICTDEERKKYDIIQDSYTEWQANEGAAQFLVPYQTFIPKYLEVSRAHARDVCASACTEKELAKFYGVSKKVVRVRTNSLNFDILHYMKFGDIGRIPLLSRDDARLAKYKGNHEKTYCRNCLSPVKSEHKHCIACGSLLKDAFWGALKYKETGAGYMKYAGIELDSSNRAKVCPRCGNESFGDIGDFCPICGVCVVNDCVVAEGDGWTDISCEDGHRLLGNYRHCPHCGKNTTFFNNGWLSSWEEAKRSMEFDTLSPSASTSDDDIPF